MNDSNAIENKNEPLPNGSNGDRDPATGKFLKGNKGGSGNPYGRLTASLRAAFLEAVSFDDMKEIARALIEKAKKGDSRAAMVLFDRVMGRVVPAPDPDRLDENEIEIKVAQRRAESVLNPPSFEDLLHF